MNIVEHVSFLPVGTSRYKIQFAKHMKLKKVDFGKVSNPVKKWDSEKMFQLVRRTHAPLCS